uniref:Uncharacterized protein n=1 Tax=Sphaerodactylus townsendi TaxID=933632 RepID=A0ACB8EWH8_9SAUR
MFFEVYPSLSSKNLAYKEILSVSSASSATAGKTMLFSCTLAVFILSVLKGIVGQSVNQSEGTVVVPQGNPIFLECGYQSSLPVNPFWYIQHPGHPPRIFLKDLGKDGSEEGARRGFEADHNKNLKTFHMKKPASQLSDSAVYFCATSDTVRLAKRGAEKKPSCKNKQKEHSQHIQ